MASSAKEYEELVQQCCARDYEDFDLEGIMAKARSKFPDPAVIDACAVILKPMAPAIFNAGYMAGALCALKLSKELRGEK